MLPPTKTTLQRLLLGAWLLLAVSVSPCTGQQLAEAPLFEPDEVLEVDVLEADREGASVLADRLDPAAPKSSEAESGKDELLDLLRDAHGWTRFEPGAWRRLQTVSEAFDSAGDFAGRSVTERTERLVSKDRDSYTLAIETVVSLAGLRKPEPSETQRFHLLTDRPYDLGEPTVSLGEATSISLGGIAIPCRLWNVEQATPNGGETDQLFLSEDRKPLVLRRERQAVAANKPATHSLQSVVRLRSPGLYGDAIAPTWHLSTAVTQPEGARSESFAVCSDQVPGGLHSESVTEYDASDRRLRWAVTRVVLAGQSPDAAFPAPGQQPGVSIEVRPRRFLRMLRREDRRAPDG